MGKPFHRSGARDRLNRAIHNAPFHFRRTTMTEAAPAHRQFVHCTIKGGTRAYTYHNDGDPLAVGDPVTIETKHGFTTGEVAAVVEEAPPFPTKAVTKLEPKPDTDAETVDG
jgi:hypothetical protein